VSNLVDIECLRKNESSDVLKLLEERRLFLKRECIGDDLCEVAWLLDRVLGRFFRHRPWVVQCPLAFVKGVGQ